MAKLSKRIRAIREKVEIGKQYSINDAVALLKEVSSVKFSEAVDVAVNLGIDPKKSDQAVRGATTPSPWHRKKCKSSSFCSR